VIGTKQFTIFTLVIVTLVGIAVTNLRRSQSGRKMLAVRANERAATMSGVSVAGTKLMAFALAAFIAGIAGGMQAYQQVNIAGPFDILSSVAIFVIAYLGGITTANGAFIAGLIAAGGVLNYVLETYLFNGSANTLQIINIVSGLAVIILSIQNPSGISGTVRSQAEWLRQRLKASSSPETTAAPPPDGIPTPAVAPTPQVSPIGPEGATLP
jgi:ABC-type branched-subunit amino acid transport system permease subunit